MGCWRLVRCLCGGLRVALRSTEYETRPLARQPAYEHGVNRDGLPMRLVSALRCPACGHQAISVGRLFSMGRGTELQCRHCGIADAHSSFVECAQCHCARVGAAVVGTLCIGVVRLVQKHFSDGVVRCVGAAGRQVAVLGY